MVSDSVTFGEESGLAEGLLEPRTVGAANGGDSKNAPLNASKKKSRERGHSAARGLQIVVADSSGKRGGCANPPGRDASGCLILVPADVHRPDGRTRLVAAWVEALLVTGIHVEAIDAPYRRGAQVDGARRNWLSGGSRSWPGQPGRRSGWCRPGCVT